MPWGLGDGPVYPVLLTNPDGGPDRTSLRYWLAPTPQRRGNRARPSARQATRSRRFQDQDHHLTAVQVLDPAAGQADNGGSWWPTFLLRVGVGCYGLQIDGATFSSLTGSPVVGRLA
jgi:hypothetical protein